MKNFLIHYYYYNHHIVQVCCDWKNQTNLLSFFHDVKKPKFSKSRVLSCNNKNEKEIIIIQSSTTVLLLVVVVVVIITTASFFKLFTNTERVQFSRIEKRFSQRNCFSALF